MMPTQEDYTTQWLLLQLPAWAARRQIKESDSVTASASSSRCSSNSNCWCCNWRSMNVLSLFLSLYNLDLLCSRGCSRHPLRHYQLVLSLPPRVKRETTNCYETKRSCLDINSAFFFFFFFPRSYSWSCVTGSNNQVRVFQTKGWSSRWSEVSQREIGKVQTTWQTSASAFPRLQITVSFTSDSSITRLGLSLASPPCFGSLPSSACTAERL